MSNSRSNLQKTHLHPLMDVCVQYEENPLHVFPRFATEKNENAVTRTDIQKTP